MRARASRRAQHSGKAKRGRPHQARPAATRSLAATAVNETISASRAAHRRSAAARLSCIGRRRYGCTHSTGQARSTAELANGDARASSACETAEYRPGSRSGRYFGDGRVLHRSSHGLDDLGPLFGRLRWAGLACARAIQSKSPCSSLVLRSPAECRQQPAAQFGGPSRNAAQCAARRSATGRLGLERGINRLLELG